MQDYSIKRENAQEVVDEFQEQYDALKLVILDLITQKQALHKAFYERFYRFIQEGTWVSEEYYDDEKYYLDALSTLYNSSVPKVSSNISVLELS